MECLNHCTTDPVVRGPSLLFLVYCAAMQQKNRGVVGPKGERLLTLQHHVFNGKSWSLSLLPSLDAFNTKHWTVLRLKVWSPVCRTCLLCPPVVKVKPQSHSFSITIFLISGAIHLVLIPTLWWNSNKSFRGSIHPGWSTAYRSDHSSWRWAVRWWPPWR